VADYITADELRTEAEASPAALPDAKAAKLIRYATTLVENTLGPRLRQTSGPQEGLKVAEADVAPYQWEMLRQAITVLGARLFHHPELTEGLRFDSVSGPDFSRSGGVGRVFGDEALALLEAANLRPTGARARP
jgi:hypothetical protein